MRDKRIHVLMDEAELKALDEWRFAHKIASRGDAVRQLVYAGVVLTTPGVVGTKLKDWVVAERESAIGELADVVASRWPKHFFPMRGENAFPDGCPCCGGLLAEFEPAGSDVYALWSFECGCEIVDEGDVLWVNEKCPDAMMLHMSDVVYHRDEVAP